MNFIEKLIDFGFVRQTFKDMGINRGQIDFNPSNGWMGLTIYHPYEVFIRGNIKFDFSLELFGVTSIVHRADGIISENKINEKHIRCFIDGKNVYENHFGIPPDEGFMKEMLK